MEFALASCGTRADVEAWATVVWSCDAEAIDVRGCSVRPGSLRRVG
jgi:hypothetical protein